MVIKSLQLISFRNHHRSDFLFDSRKNLIFGINGAGKTSVLEAIFLLGFGKSFLNIRKEDMVGYRSDGFLVKGMVESQWGGNKIVSSYLGGINLFLNDQKVKISQLNRYFFPVIFTSADYSKYLERKAYKRKLFNRFIFGFEDLYIQRLLDYNKTVKKKNILLKRTIESAELKSWNQVLADSSINLVETRMAFVEQLNKYVEKINPQLKIRYHPSLSVTGGISRERFLRQLSTFAPREKKYQRCLIGPHLDNYQMEYGGKDLQYCSSGEKKLYLLMIFVAMLNYYREHRGEYPVFLIDDFNSAIDDRGLDFLFSILPPLQIIATSIHDHSAFDHVTELSKEN